MLFIVFKINTKIELVTTFCIKCLFNLSESLPDNLESCQWIRCQAQVSNISSQEKTHSNLTGAKVKGKKRSTF